MGNTQINLESAMNDIGKEGKSKINELFSSIGGFVGLIYAAGLTLADTYFCYRWVADGDSNWFIELISLSCYGWIWTTIQALAWPYYVYQYFM